MTDDEVVGWHHRLDGYEFKQTPESWWWTRKPDVLQSMGSKRVGHDWQLNWTDLKEDTEKVNFGVINDDFKVHIKKKKRRNDLGTTWIKKARQWYILTYWTENKHEHIVVSWWNVVTNHHGPNTQHQCLSVANLLSSVSLYTTDFLLSYSSNDENIGDEEG